MPVDTQEPSDARGSLEEARFLADASALLASSFDYRATLAAVARRAVPVLADACVVDLLEAGALRRLERSAAVRQALQTREVVVTSTGARSTMIVPLVARDAVLGVITLVVAQSGRRYSEASVATARDLAARAAKAIDNARLFERAQEALRSREDALTSVSHDLRSPLLGILLTVETMLRTARRENRGKAAEQLERVRRGALQMHRMIDDLLPTAQAASAQATPVASADKGGPRPAAAPADAKPDSDLTP
jgi:K+-sensing histidine kinase KdpD